MTATPVLDVPTSVPARAPGTYRPRLSYYHANAKGTGSALSLELHPAHDQTEGSIFICLAPQKSIGSRQAQTVVFPSFDWKNAITVKLGVSDLAQILQVMRGIQESVQEGKGLFHQSAKGNTIIRFSHLIEPRPGYALDVSRKTLAGDLQRCSFLLDASEAFYLMLALEQTAGVIAFGIPTVIPRVRPEERMAYDPQAEIRQPVSVNDPF